MPSTRSGTSYNPSSSSRKGSIHDYGRGQSVTEGQGVDTAIEILCGHIKIQPYGLQQFISEQIVPDLCRSVEKLHELLPDCEKGSGPSQHLKVTQLMEKKNMMLLTAEWSENNPPPPSKCQKQPQ
ncbi:hypothetical protein O181_018468 [Austropuccinia psidii MF-1]|uniref:Uncharacterized protein n=1 Tax=Austropuccinia psidii MF-1 TaxID=1389203 RepID=A0A9Q3C954_9BASI|nr:hypothetical protein [Austropuccinia psidii MF-1]